MVFNCMACVLINIRSFVHRFVSTSGEAENAGVREPLPDMHALRPGDPAAGGHERLLPQLHHPAGDERPVPGHPLHDLRGHAGPAEPRPALQPADPHPVRRHGRGHCRGNHDAAGRVQDAAQHPGAVRPEAGHVHQRHDLGVQDSLRVPGISGILPRAAGARRVPGTGHRHLVVGVRVLQVRHHQAQKQGGLALSGHAHPCLVSRGSKINHNRQL